MPTRPVLPISRHITERAVHRIVTELVEAGYISRERKEARNRYQVHAELPLRYDGAKDPSVSELLELLVEAGTLNGDQVGPRGQNGEGRPRSARERASG